MKNRILNASILFTLSLPTFFTTKATAQSKSAFEFVTTMTEMYPEMLSMKETIGEMKPIEVRINGRSQQASIGSICWMSGDSTVANFIVKISPDYGIVISSIQAGDSIDVSVGGRLFGLSKIYFYNTAPASKMKQLNTIKGNNSYFKLEHPNPNKGTFIYRNFTRILDTVIIDSERIEIKIPDFSCGKQ